MLLARCVVDGNERGVRRRRRRNATSSSRFYFKYRISVVPRLAARGQRRCLTEFCRSIVLISVSFVARKTFVNKTYATTKNNETAALVLFSKDFERMTRF